MARTYEEVVTTVLSQTDEDTVKDTIRLFNPEETRPKNISRLNHKRVQKQSLEETITFLDSIKGNYPSATQ